jgi:hypothetical protein
VTHNEDIRPIAWVIVPLLFCQLILFAIHAVGADVLAVSTIATLAGAAGYVAGVLAVHRRLRREEVDLDSLQYSGSDSQARLEAQAKLDAELTASRLRQSGDPD